MNNYIYLLTSKYCRLSAALVTTKAFLIMQNLRGIDYKLDTILYCIVLYYEALY